MTIQAMVDALPPSGGVVAIPAGVTSIAQPLAIRSGVTLRGAGRGVTILDGAGIANQTGARIGGVLIQDMTINGDGTGIGMDLFDVDRSMFERVVVQNFATGVQLKSALGAYHNVFLNCAVQDGYILTGSGSFEGPNSTRIIGGEANKIGGTAIVIDGGNNILLEGIAISDGTVIGVDAFAPSYTHQINVTIIGCRFEHPGPNTTAIRLGSHAIDCRVMGNWIATAITTPLDNRGSKTLSDIGGVWS